MKKLLVLLAFNFTMLVMYAQLPTAIGDFVLGNSMSSVEELLNAKGLKKVEIGFLQEATYAKNPSIVMAEGGEMIQARFPISNPYLYAGDKWPAIDLYFYQGKLFKIEFSKGYWTEAFEDDATVKDCQKSKKNLEKNMNSKYAKYQKDKFDNPYHSLITYSDAKTSISIEYGYAEYEGVSLSYKLFDSAIDKKVFPSDYE